MLENHLQFEQLEEDTIQLYNQYGYMTYLSPFMNMLGQRRANKASAVKLIFNKLEHPRKSDLVYDRQCRERENMRQWVKVKRENGYDVEINFLTGHEDKQERKDNLKRATEKGKRKQRNGDYWPDVIDFRDNGFELNGELLQMFNENN